MSTVIAFPSPEAGIRRTLVAQGLSRRCMELVMVDLMPILARLEAADCSFSVPSEFSLPAAHRERMSIELNKSFAQLRDVFAAELLQLLVRMHAGGDEDGVD